MSKPNHQVSLLFVNCGTRRRSSKDVRSHIAKAANRKKKALLRAGLSVLPAGSKTVLAQEATWDETGALGLIPRSFDEFRVMDHVARVAPFLTLVPNPDTVLPAQLAPEVLRIMRKYTLPSPISRTFNQPLSD
jgi:hypothetical protein